jgi:hypothetical protein
MKRIILVASIASVSLLSACGGGMTEEEIQNAIDDATENMLEEEEEDNLFVSEDGNFSVDFLGQTPTKTSSNVPTDVGDVEINMFMYEKSVTEALMVAYSDYPSEMIDESDGADNLLQGAKNGALGNLGITSTDVEKKIDIDGHPGLFFTGNNGQYFVTYEVYLVHNRLYQVAILRDGSYASDEDRNTFLGSFKLTSDEKGDSE